MMRAWITQLRSAFIGVMLALPMSAAADEVQEAMQDYTDFAPYLAGIIQAKQLTQDIFDSVHFIDTRHAEDFAAGTIPGAHHIEWRAIFGNLDAVPETGKVVLFCNTGALSAQAAFGLRVLGYDNVLVLQGGYDAWLRDAGFRPAG